MIESQAFNQQLASGLETLGKTYLFYGQTPFLSEENAQLLIKAAQEKGYQQRDIFYIDNRSKFQGLVNNMQSPGLFDPKKIIELRFDTDKPTKKIGEQVVRIAAHQTENLLLIQASGLNYKTQKEKWFTQLAQQATTVVSKPIYANQLPNWIHHRATQMDLPLTSGALKTIMQFSEGNLLWTNQILLQLVHSDYQRPIEANVIESILADMSVFQVNDLSQAVLNKNRNALKIIDKLKQENQPLVLINAVLYREFENLVNISQSGLAFSAACRQLRIWQSKQKTYQAALNVYNPKQLTDFIRQLAKLDKINKGQDKGDGWALLNKAVSQLLIYQ